MQLLVTGRSTAEDMALRRIATYIRQFFSSRVGAGQSAHLSEIMRAFEGTETVGATCLFFLVCI